MCKSRTTCGGPVLYVLYPSRCTSVQTTGSRLDYPFRCDFTVNKLLYLVQFNNRSTVTKSKHGALKCRRSQERIFVCFPVVLESVSRNGFGDSDIRDNDETATVSGFLSQFLTILAKRERQHAYAYLYFHFNSGFFVAFNHLHHLRWETFGTSCRGAWDFTRVQISIYTTQN